MLTSRTSILLFGGAEVKPRTQRGLRARPRGSPVKQSLVAPVTPTAAPVRLPHVGHVVEVWTMIRVQPQRLAGGLRLPNVGARRAPAPGTGTDEGRVARECVRGKARGEVWRELAGGGGENVIT